MANSRIMLVCRHCGEGFVLGKGDFGSYYNPFEDMRTELNEFYKKHEHGICSSETDFSDNARDHFVILEKGETLKAVEDAEKKRGRWEVTVHPLLKDKDVSCSVCGHSERRGPAWDISWGMSEYCPACGAKMDGGIV